MPDKLIVKNLEIVFKEEGRRTKALKNINFKVKENEFICLLGPTGCGKTSILNAIAGFVKPTKGEILLSGEKITEPTKEVGIVFQHNILFPWKTVKGNIGMGPKINNAPKNEIEKITSYYLQLIGLKKYENYYPSELSGGMQQRVGIARALANTPEIILMDEPFGSLDAYTRARMQEQIQKIWQKHKKTILFVTHDIDEALILSDRILIMSKRPGEIKKEIKNNMPEFRTYKMTTEMGYIELKRKIIDLLN